MNQEERLKMIEKLLKPRKAKETHKRYSFDGKLIERKEVIKDVITPANQVVNIMDKVMQQEEQENQTYSWSDLIKMARELS